jgi:iron-sulfur cluster repair protein YtfE (RIC family)
MGKKKCKLCKRKMANKNMSQHHLTPRYSGHINGEFHYNHRRLNKIPMCKECHDTVHHQFTNEELYYEFNTLDKLKEELKSRVLDEVFGKFSFIVEEKKEQRAHSISDIISGCQPDEPSSTAIQNIAENLGVPVLEAQVTFKAT